MIRYTRIVFALFFLATAAASNAQDTLRIMTYNILNFSGSSSDRIDELRMIMRAVQPDIVVHQEVLDQSAVNNILSQVYRQMDPDWEAANFINGPDTDNACFYLSSRVSLVSQRQIPTQLRDFSEYVLTSAALNDGEVFRIYSAHLKASQGSDEEQRRLAECQVLRGQIELLDPGSLYMLAGDLNLYSSFEPAYQYLLGLVPGPDSRLLDPINRPGAWNNSVTFADIHTQSPRVASFGGGSTGGMDDRFDFILASAAWMDTVGAYIIPSSYHAYGNDGLHFNQAINNGTNQAVPDSIADALHDCADHLPVVVDVVLRGSGTPIFPIAPLAESPAMLHCYPNPFNSQIAIDVSASPISGRLRVFNALGRTVSLMPISAEMATQSLHLDFSNQTSGIYFVMLQRGSKSEVTKIILQK